MRNLGLSSALTSLAILAFATSLWAGEPTCERVQTAQSAAQNYLRKKADGTFELIADKVCVSFTDKGGTEKKYTALLKYDAGTGMVTRDLQEGSGAKKMEASCAWPAFDKAVSISSTADRYKRHGFDLEATKDVEELRDKAGAVLATRTTLTDSKGGLLSREISMKNAVGFTETHTTELSLIDTYSLLDAAGAKLEVPIREYEITYVGSKKLTVTWTTAVDTSGAIPGKVVYEIRSDGSSKDTYKVVAVGAKCQ